MGGLGLVTGYSERIDAWMQAVLAARLARRGSADAERRARWRYRLGGAIAAARLE